MKLNDFYNKPKKVVKKQATQFVLQNDAAELKYSKQIQDLQEEMVKYKKLQKEYVQLKTELESSRLTGKSYRETITKLETNIKRLDMERETQAELALSVPKLKQQKENLNSELLSIRSELETRTATALEQSTTLSLLGKDVEQFKSDNKALQITNELLQSSINSVNTENEKISKNNVEFKSFAEEMSKINKELTKNNQDLAKAKAYWEKESELSKIYVDRASEVEKNLTDWTATLQKQKDVDTSVKGELNKKVVTLEDTIKDMSIMIDGLMNEVTDLNQYNKILRKEVAKPRYLSMGSIALKEGFKMPQGKENIRTHNLGNSAPTLLKFKAEGENHDN